MRVNTSYDMVQGMYVELVSVLGYYKALRGNGVVIFSFVSHCGGSLSYQYRDIAGKEIGEHER